MITFLRCLQNYKRSPSWQSALTFPTHVNKWRYFIDASSTHALECRYFIDASPINEQNSCDFKYDKSSCNKKFSYLFLISNILNT